MGSGIAALCAGSIVVTEKSGRIHNYEWVGYLSILVLLLSLILGRVIFRNMDRNIVITDNGSEEKGLARETIRR